MRLVGGMLMWCGGMGDGLWVATDQRAPFIIGTLLSWAGVLLVFKSWHAGQRTPEESP